MTAIQLAMIVTVDLSGLLTILFACGRVYELLLAAGWLPGPPISLGPVAAATTHSTLTSGLGLVDNSVARLA